MTTETVHAAQGVSADSALFSLIQRLADNKYWLGRRYAEWCTAAPTLESAVAASAMAQDEIGHARSHYPLFRQFTGIDTEPEDRGVFHSMAALDQPFGSWIDFVATNFLVDTALTTLYESAADSSYDDLRNRARRIVGEEGIHWLHGQGWVRRLARDSTGTKQALSAALGRQAHEVLMWFGAPESSEVNDLVARKVLGIPPDGMRWGFRERVAPVLDLTDIAVDVISDASSALPWQRWDDERYRLRGE